MTYIATGEGWLYLAAILDLFSRKVVGWAMSETMPQELTLAALHMAITNRQPGPGLLHHSDRGSQGGLNWSSQHVVFAPLAGTGPALQQVFSSQGSRRVFRKRRL